MQCIASPLIKPSTLTALWVGSVTVDLGFFCNARVVIPLCQWYSYSYIHRKINYQYTNLQNYITVVCTPLTTDANPDGKKCLTASKLFKESEKHIYCKKILWFQCIVYSNLWYLNALQQQHSSTVTNAQNLLMIWIFYNSN